MGLGGLFEGEWAKAHLLNVLNHFPGVNAWARENSFRRYSAPLVLITPLILGSRSTACLNARAVALNDPSKM